eukprot:9483261-Pyramimonas_sp.AAC.1
MVCSSVALERAVTTRLDSAGVRLRCERAVRDLGVMTTAGKRRCTRKVKERQRKARKKAQKVSCLTKLVSRASRSHKPVALAVGPWGHEVLGFTPSQ